ncbi:MAG: SDR family oxidoreductase [Archaeoglobaceae archaeon]
MDVSGRTVIVTGSGRGIGKAIAVLLAQKGAKVVVTARTKSEIDKVRDEIRSAGGDAISFPADVTQPDSVKDMVQTTIQEYGSVDILVNNAGTGIRKLFTETSQEELDNVMKVNVEGVFLCCQEVLPHMISKRDGVIINISSGAGKSGFPELSAYCASKFAVNGLTESVAQEVIDYNVRIYGVCPGSANTSLYRNLFPERAGNLTSPEKVAESVLKVCKEGFRQRPGKCMDVY